LGFWKQAKIRHKLGRHQILPDPAYTRQPYPVFLKGLTMRLLRASLLSLFALAAFASVAAAQETPRVGIMAGFNQSYFATSPQSDTSAGQGYLVGGFMVFRRDKYFQIQPEFQITQRKATANYPSGDSTYDTTYANLVMNFRLKVYKALYSTQGVGFAVPMTASLDVAGGSADYKDNIANDISIVIGLGAQLGRIGIEGRWDSGMKGVEEVPLGGYVKRNRAITFVGIFGF
jgi:hypothetical protein